MRRAIWVLALAMMVLGCGGSGDSGPGKADAGGGPKDTIRKAAEAMKAGDGEALKSCYIHNEQGARLLEAMAAAGRVNMAFCEKMEAAYGKASIAEMVRSSPLRMLIDLDKATLYGGEDETATVMYEGEPLLSINLRKRDGGWMILGLPEEPTAERVDRYIELSLPMQKGMESVMGDIGADGVTAEDIMGRLGKAMAETGD